MVLYRAGIRMSLRKMKRIVHACWYSLYGYLSFFWKRVRGVTRNFFWKVSGALLYAFFVIYTLHKYKFRKLSWVVTPEHFLEPFFHLGVFDHPYIIFFRTVSGCVISKFVRTLQANWCMFVLFIIFLSDTWSGSGLSPQKIYDNHLCF